MYICVCVCVVKWDDIVSYRFVSYRINSIQQELRFPPHIMHIVDSIT